MIEMEVRAARECQTEYLIGYHDKYCDNNKVLGVIPARWKSSRFPGKPLELIGDKPMIWHVYKQCVIADCFHHVLIATDDSRIMDVCSNLHIPYRMTKDTHRDCLDRVAEVSASMPEYNIVVCIQGDEPFIDPYAIQKVLLAVLDGGDDAACGCAEITNPLEVVATNVPKVVVDESGYAMYLSRQPVPYPKGYMNFPYLSQVCVYAFRPEILQWFVNTKRGLVEEAESIGLIRFIEHGIPVKMVKVPASPVSVDTPADLKRAREYYASKNT